MKVFSVNGLVALLVLLTLLLYFSFGLYECYKGDMSLSGAIIPILGITGVLGLCLGFTTVEPNTVKLFTFLGKYKGILDENGLSWVIPFYSGIELSTKQCTVQSGILKVNDLNNTPIEISCSMNYVIEDPYKAVFDVEDYELYIENQFEVCLRQYAKGSSYETLASHEDDFIASLNEKTKVAGVKILDTKIIHLNYSPEIAQSMLQRQQAIAMSEARSTIVQNATRIANEAAESIFFQDTTNKSTFICNLLLVLCSNKEATPTISLS